MKRTLTRVALPALALTLAATTALAQPGNGNAGGGGNDRGGDAPADHVQPQRGNRNAEGNANASARPQGEDARPRGNAMQEARSQADRRPQGGGAQGEARGNDRAERVVERGDNRGRGEERGPAAAGRGVTAGNRERAGEWRDAPLRYVYGDDRRARDGVRYVGLLDGCPPGLAAKRNGCQPPGQARKTRWLVRDRYDLGWWGLPRYDSGWYRYDDGYLLRLGDGGRVSAYIPLLGGALAVGEPWPRYYGYDRLAPYYTDYYGLGGYGSYRYADNVVYRLDPETAAITSIAALLTGDDFAVGGPLPGGYDVYNVPYTWREQYYDSPDAWYRYSDGYVYEVDPTTRLIVAAIELLA